MLPLRVGLDCCARCVWWWCVCVLQRCCYCIEREWMGCEVWVLSLFWSVIFRDGKGIHILHLAHNRIKCCHILRWLAWWGEVWHQLLLLAVFQWWSWLQNAWESPSWCYRVTIKIRFDFELNLLNNPQLHISAIVSVLGNVGKLC